MITLQPVVIRRPTKELIYAPTNREPTKEITENAFQKYSGVKILVSFEPDFKSNPKECIAYIYELDYHYFYIIPGEQLEWLSDEDSVFLSNVLK